MLPVCALSAVIMLSSCDSGESGGVSDLDQNVRAQTSAHGLTGDPSRNRTLPSVDSPKAQLGMKLFFSKGLGGDNDSACVTCHHPVLGGGDGLALPIGVGAAVPDLLGPGRFHNFASTGFDGGPTVPRNSPSVFNLGLWDETLFWDGRIESAGKTAGMNGADGLGIRTPDTAFGVLDPNAGDNLAAAQARFPVTSNEEMRGFTFQAGMSNSDLRAALASKFTAFGGWDGEFTTAFGDATITYDRIAEAISEYERSMVFVDTPWKRYVEGDLQAIDESAKRGAQLFFNDAQSGGANCASCHSGDFFTDESFHVTAIPQIGRGKGNGATGTDDFGRFRETADPNDMYKFRTPSLLNVEVTGPWGHSGVYSTLDAVVRHMLNPRQAVDNFDFSQLSPDIQATEMQANTALALSQLDTNRQTGQSPKVLRDFGFTDTDVSDLVAFLKTLTDPCVKDRSCLAPWIPDASDANPDGLRLNGVDVSGGYL